MQLVDSIAEDACRGRTIILGHSSEPHTRSDSSAASPTRTLMTIPSDSTAMSYKDESEVEEDDEFRCTICDETFDSQQELEEHGIEAHEDGDLEDHEP